MAAPHNYPNKTNIRGNQRGLFIVLEGLDKVGKTTTSGELVKLLQKKYKRRAVYKTFPRRDSIIGKILNDYLLCENELQEHVQHLLFAANRWEHMEEIDELLNDGVTIIMDRYSLSGIVYSMMHGMDYEWCQGTENGMIQPDYTFYLNLDVMRQKERLADSVCDRYEENMETQLQLRSIFEKLVKKDDSIVSINANVATADILKQVEEVIQQRFDVDK